MGRELSGSEFTLRLQDHIKVEAAIHPNKPFDDQNPIGAIAKVHGPIVDPLHAIVFLPCTKHCLRQRVMRLIFLRSISISMSITCVPSRCIRRADCVGACRCSIRARPCTCLLLLSAWVES